MSFYFNKSRLSASQRLYEYTIARLGLPLRPSRSSPPPLGRPSLNSLGQIALEEQEWHGTGIPQAPRACLADKPPTLGLREQSKASLGAFPRERRPSRWHFLSNLPWKIVAGKFSFSFSFLWLRVFCLCFFSSFPLLHLRRDETPTLRSWAIPRCVA